MSPESRKTLKAKLKRLKFMDHFRHGRVLHAPRFADFSREWNFESVVFWLDHICNYANTRILTRKAGPSNMTRVSSAREARAALSEGQSLQISGLHRQLGASDPLSSLYFAIGEYLGVAVDEIGMFVTPSSQKAIKRHHDEMDVITLQLQGHKHWDIWAGVALKDCGRIAPRFAIDLKPGSLLFVPAFTPHSVVAGADFSLSVAFPLYTRSYRELLLELQRVPGIARLLAHSLPQRNEFPKARGHWDRLTAALASVSDERLSAALECVALASSQGKTKR